MSLQLIADSLDTLPEAVRSFYEEADGKFRLKVEGLEDTGGLKSALKAEREAKKELEKKVRKWESLGKSDEEIAALLAKQESDAEKAAREKGDFDSVLAQHKSKWERERDALLAERDALAASERRATVGNTLTSALAKAGATEEGLELLTDRLEKRIKSETVEGKRLHRVMAADGVTPLAGSASDGFATLDDLVGEAMKKWPSLFKARGNGGSGTPPNKAGGAGKRTITTAEFNGLSAKQRAAVMAEGRVITD